MEIDTFNNPNPLFLSSHKFIWIQHQAADKFQVKFTFQETVKFKFTVEGIFAIDPTLPQMANWSKTPYQLEKAFKSLPAMSYQTAVALVFYMHGVLCPPSKILLSKRTVGEPQGNQFYLDFMQEVREMATVRFGCPLITEGMGQVHETIIGPDPAYINQRLALKVTLGLVGIKRRQQVLYMNPFGVMGYMREGMMYVKQSEMLECELTGTDYYVWQELFNDAPCEEEDLVRAKKVLDRLVVAQLSSVESREVLARCI